MIETRACPEIEDAAQWVSGSTTRERLRESLRLICECESCKWRNRVDLESKQLDDLLALVLTAIMIVGLFGVGAWLEWRERGGL